jgi:dephospho-CoA kinase
MHRAATGGWQARGWALLLNRKPRIGITGGIGSGKSTVARLLAESGACVIESDALNRAQLADPQVVATLRGWWGEDIIGADQTLDKARIAERVFSDAEARARLEGFLHPRIAAERDRLIAACEADPDIWAVVLDTPLLLESGLDAECDAVLFVDADDAVRRQRVLERRGWTEAEWVRRENSQMGLDKKRESADHVVSNNSTDLDELRHEVSQLLARLGAPPRD